MAKGFCNKFGKVKKATKNDINKNQKIERAKNRRNKNNV